MNGNRAQTDAINVNNLFDDVYGMARGCQINRGNAQQFHPIKLARACQCYY